MRPFELRKSSAFLVVVWNVRLGPGQLKLAKHDEDILNEGHEKAARDREA